MKLYTEEQVRTAIAMGYDWCHQKHIPSDHILDSFINSLTTITLPSDEEIEKEVEYIAHNYFDMHNSNHFQGLKEGAEKMAKWMRDKIQNR